MTPDDLKAWREANHYTQGELAQELAKDRRTVIRWENGSTIIPDTLEQGLAPLEREARPAQEGAQFNVLSAFREEPDDEIDPAATYHWGVWPNSSGVPVEGAELVRIKADPPPYKLQGKLSGLFYRLRVKDGLAWKEPPSVKAIGETASAMAAAQGSDILVSGIDPAPKRDPRYQPKPDATKGWMDRGWLYKAFGGR